MKKNVHYSDDFNLNFEDIFLKRAVGCLNVYLKLVIFTNLKTSKDNYQSFF